MRWVVVAVACAVAAVARGQPVTSTARVWEVASCAADEVFNVDTLDCTSCLQNPSTPKARVPSTATWVRDD